LGNSIFRGIKNEGILEIPRGNPKGREYGVKLDKRENQPIHFKGTHQKKRFEKNNFKPHREQARKTRTQ
jgi:hypothetical protein